MAFFRDASRLLAALVLLGSWTPAFGAEPIVDKKPDPNAVDAAKVRAAARDTLSLADAAVYLYAPDEKVGTVPDGGASCGGSAGSKTYSGRYALLLLAGDELKASVPVFENFGAAVEFGKIKPIGKTAEGGLFLTVPYFGDCDGNFGEVYYVTPDLQILDLRTQLWNAPRATWIESKRELKSCGSADDKTAKNCDYYSFQDSVLTKVTQGNEKPEVIPKPAPPADANGATAP